MSAAPVAPLKLVSSMATRHALADLVRAYEAETACAVGLEAVGGVEAAKRVRAGEAFDVVVLAAEAVDTLAGEGRIVAGSRVDIARSGIALAVRAGAPRPDIGSAEAVCAALLAAARIGYSTGPSGTHLLKLVERWGIAETLHERLVQAPPGVPVATLIARGEVGLGVQQHAELVGVPGVDVLGPLPEAIQATTIFAGGIAAASRRQHEARALLAFLAGPRADAAKRRYGLAPA